MLIDQADDQPQAVIQPAALPLSHGPVPQFNDHSDPAVESGEIEQSLGGESTTAEQGGLEKEIERGLILR